MSFNPLQNLKKIFYNLSTFFILNSSFKQKYQRNFIDKTFFTNMQPLFINSKSNINNSLFNPGFKDQLMPVVVSLLSIRCFVLLPYKRRNRGWGGGRLARGLNPPHPIFFLAKIDITNTCNHNNNPF